MHQHSTAACSNRPCSARHHTAAPGIDLAHENTVSISIILKAQLHLPAEVCCGAGALLHKAPDHISVVHVRGDECNHSLRQCSSGKHLVGYVSRQLRNTAYTTSRVAACEGGLQPPLLLQLWTQSSNTPFFPHHSAGLVSIPPGHPVEACSDRGVAATAGWQRLWCLAGQLQPPAQENSIALWDGDPRGGTLTALVLSECKMQAAC